VALPSKGPAQGSEQKGASPINGHDITCINKELDLLKNHPEFVYKPHKLASPQYSDAFANWLINEFEKDRQFFTRMRANYRRRMARKKR
jgi:hypothetical protein